MYIISKHAFKKKSVKMLYTLVNPHYISHCFIIRYSLFLWCLLFRINVMREETDKASTMTC